MQDQFIQHQDCPTLKQSMIDWKATAVQFWNRSKEHYNIKESKTVPIILNWLGCEGLRFIQMVNNKEEENAKQVQGCSKY